MWSRPLVINCAHVTRRGDFFEAQTEEKLRWLHFSASDTVEIPMLGRTGNIQRLASCFKAARAACDLDASLVITHDPRISFVVQHFLRLFGYSGPHLAYFFNYPWLPVGFKKSIQSLGFKGIDRFVVYSKMEVHLYHEYFNIPMERIKFIHLGLAVPIAEPAAVPIIDGDYICAIGGQSRDYRTLIEVSKRIPEVNIVIVGRPGNIAGIEIPSNVKVMTNIPYGQAMNILLFSRFMVLPLNSASVPCGHITVINAMHLSKAVAVTRSVGIADYVREGENALMFSANNIDEMTEVVRDLWHDPGLCAQLGSSGREFAAAFCSESGYFKGFTEVVKELGVYKD